MRLAQSIWEITRSVQFLRVANQVIELFVNLYRPQGFQRNMFSRSNKLKKKWLKIYERKKKKKGRPALSQILLWLNEKLLDNWCGFEGNCKEGVNDLFCWAYMYIATAGTPTQFLAERTLEWFFLFNTHYICLPFFFWSIIDADFF